MYIYIYIYVYVYVYVYLYVYITGITRPRLDGERESGMEKSNQNLK